MREHVPPPARSVTANPDTVQTEVVVEVSVTVRPADDLTTAVKFEPSNWSGGCTNVMT